MLIAARVVDIVLQKNSLISEELSKIPGGSHGSIGDIKFEYIGEGGRNRYGYAKPLSDHVKYYPVKNEVVLLIKAPSKGFYISRSNVHNYYLSTVNLWKNQNHNALPKESKNITEADIKSERYQQAEGGIPNQPINPMDELEIDLGNHFIEKSIKGLLPYEGDYILEGRNGQSIRLGITVNNEILPEENKSPWSDGGNIGDPITIISNGLPKDPTKYLNNNIEDDSIDSSWIHTIEDINKDPSSIYLTSNQKLKYFKPAGVGNPSFAAGAPENKTEVEAISEGTNYINSPKLRKSIIPADTIEDKPLTPPITIKELKETPVLESNITQITGNEKTPFYIHEDTTDVNKINYLKSISAETINTYKEGINVPELNLEQKIGNYFKLKHLIYTPKCKDIDYQQTSNIHPDAVFEREEIGFYVEINNKGKKTINIKEYINGEYRTLDNTIEIHAMNSVSPFQYKETDTELIRKAESRIFGNFSQYGIDSYPGIDLGIEQGTIISNLQKLFVNCIDPIISPTGIGSTNLHLLSVYRSRALNNILKGNSLNSEHIYGYAADIRMGGGNNQGLFNWCYNNLEFKNLMWAFPEREKESWIHISYIEGENTKNTTLASESEIYHNQYKGIRRGRDRKYQDNIIKAMTPNLT